MEGALQGITVLDFSTLLPGPLATALLAQAGAEILKIEKPGQGDDLRHYPPLSGGKSLSFDLLNRGKKSIVLDLKNPESVEKLTSLIKKADILVEQYRPGVMDRLGLGYETVKQINPAIVYCSISGYGQTGPDRGKAGHDLNYIAESGLLSLTGAADGRPVIPPGLIADIGGGAYPAVMNILMALLQAGRTGAGCHLDISMAGNLMPWMWWAVAEQKAAGRAPKTNGSLLSGGSPRYQIYQTADGRYLAVAPLEDKFWHRFCDLIDLPQLLRGHMADANEVITAVSDRIAADTADEWMRVFEGQDVCCSLVKSLDETAAWVGSDPFLPVCAAVSGDEEQAPAPDLGEHDKLISGS